MLLKRRRKKEGFKNKLRTQPVVNTLLVNELVLQSLSLISRCIMSAVCRSHVKLYSGSVSISQSLSVNFFIKREAPVLKNYQYYLFKVQVKGFHCGENLGI